MRSQVHVPLLIKSDDDNQYDFGLGSNADAGRAVKAVAGSEVRTHCTYYLILRSLLHLD